MPYPVSLEYYQRQELSLLKDENNGICMGAGIWLIRKESVPLQGN